MMRAGRKILLILPLLALFQLLWAVPAVHAHGGIEAGQNPFTAWNWNPLPTLLLLLKPLLLLTSQMATLGLTPTPTNTRPNTNIGPDTNLGCPVVSGLFRNLRVRLSVDET